MVSSINSHRLDRDEIRRIVQHGIDRGLIRKGNTIEKNGEEAAQNDGLRSQWMEVDPETARRWLENNFRNRPVAKDVVTAYARDMRNGVWVPTHQGIAFNDRDELIDGQHRLMAIIECGATIRMMVTFGLPSVIEGSEMTTMDAVDRGRTRSVADQLKIQHGMKQGSIIAAVTASIATICSGERTRRLSVGQTLEIYRAFQNGIDWMIAHRSRQHGLRQTGVLAGFAFALAAEGGDGSASTPVSLMFERMIAEDEGGGTAMRCLREFLTSDEAKLLTRSFNRGLAELVMSAILLDLRGEKVAVLEMSTEGGDHFRELQAERVGMIREMLQVEGGAR